MLRIYQFIKNLLWIILGGLWLFLLWSLFGILLCISIIGVPFGIQCFKIAKFSFLPYKKKISLNFRKHPIANILWAIIGGWEMAIFHLMFGIANCLTVIGVSKGIQCFKIMKLSFAPFGAVIK